MDQIPPLFCAAIFSLSFFFQVQIQNEATYQACRAYGLGEHFKAAAEDEGTFGEWLDELPLEVAATARLAARLLKHYTRSGAWVEITPGSPSQVHVACGVDARWLRRSWQVHGGNKYDLRVDWRVSLFVFVIVWCCLW